VEGRQPIKLALRVECLHSASQGGNGRTFIALPTRSLASYPYICIQNYTLPG